MWCTRGFPMRNGPNRLIWVNDWRIFASEMENLASISIEFECESECSCWMGNFSYYRGIP